MIISWRKRVIKEVRFWKRLEKIYSTNQVDRTLFTPKALIWEELLVTVK